MNIVEALQQEESKLQCRLTAIESAIAALNSGITPTQTSSPNGASAKRTMSAVVRARISQKAKARWAKIRAKKAKAN